MVFKNQKTLDTAIAQIILDKYDKKGNGVITTQQAELVVQDFFKLVKPEYLQNLTAKSVIMLSDIDNSKTLDVDEVGFLVRSLDNFCKPEFHTYVNAIWKKYDSDQSGLLEKAELGQLLSDIGGGQTATGQEVEKILKRVSKDGDFSVNKFEFMFVLSEWYARTCSED